MTFVVKTLTPSQDKIRCNRKRRTIFKEDEVRKHRLIDQLNADANVSSKIYFAYVKLETMKFSL